MKKFKDVRISIFITQRAGFEKWWGPGPGGNAASVAGVKVCWGSGGTTCTLLKHAPPDVTLGGHKVASPNWIKH